MKKSRKLTSRQIIKLRDEEIRALKEYISRLENKISSLENRINYDFKRKHPLMCGV